MYKSSADQMNQVYAASSFWQDNINTPRYRLQKTASGASTAIGAGLGAGAGYLTSGEKSSTRKRITRAAVGGALGAGAGFGISKLRGKANKAGDKKKTVEEAAEKVDSSSTSEAEKTLIEKLKKMFTKKASMQGAAVGAAAIGAYGGISSYRKHRRKPGQSQSEAEFAAQSRKDYLDHRAKKGLKVSILDRKLNEMDLQAAAQGRRSLNKAVVKGVLGGAITGAAAGHFATRGRAK